MNMSEALFKLLEEAERNKDFKDMHEEAVTDMVIGTMIHASGFLHNGLPLGKKLNIKQYADLKIVAARLQHVLENP